MAPPTSPLKLLRRTPGPVTDQAMVDALPSADGVTANQIAQTFLDRRSTIGLVALVQRFGLLPAATQETMLRHQHLLGPAIRKVLDQPSPIHACHAAELARLSGDVHLAEWLALRLTRSDDPAAPKVAQALLAIAQHEPNDPLVGQALDMAARAHGLHGLDAVLVAALHRLPRPLPKLTQAMAHASSPTVQAVRKLAKQATQPGIQRRLLAMGRLPNARQAACQGLQKLCETGQTLAALSQCHLLTLADAKAPLRRLPDPRMLWPNSGQIQDPKHAPAQRLLPTLAQCLPGEEAARFRRLASLSQAADPAARVAALRQLLQSRPARANESQRWHAVASFLLDDQPAIARLAFQSAERHHPAALSPWLEKMAEAKQPHTRALALPLLQTQRFDRIWKQWQRAQPATRRQWALQLLKNDPAIAQRLAKPLIHGPRHDQRQALSMVRVLGLAEMFEASLIHLTQHPDRHLAASAVVLLSSVPTKNALLALVHATKHSDARVRANALEALPTPNHRPVRPPKALPKPASNATATTNGPGNDIQQTTETRNTNPKSVPNPATSPAAPPHQLWLKHCNDPANRPRANAIAALADQGQGDWLQQLKTMLKDERPAHRLSALWVVESRNVLEAADTLAEQAVSDQLPNIRKRAHRALQSLLKQNQGPVVVPVSDTQNLPNEHPTTAGSIPTSKLQTVVKTDALQRVQTTNT